MKSLLFILLCATAAHGQYTRVPTSQYSRGLPVNQVKPVNTFDTFNNPLDEKHEYKGTPYLNKEFVKGVVETTQGKFSGLDMRFDIYGDMIEIRANDSVFMMPADTSIRKVEVGKTLLVTGLLTEQRKRFSSYFSPVEPGKVSVLKKMTVNYTPWKESLVDPIGTAPRFDRGKDMYFLAVGDKYPLVAQSMKEIMALLPDKRDEMEKFSRADGTSFKKPETLRRFAQHYNRLVK